MYCPLVQCVYTLYTLMGLQMPSIGDKKGDSNAPYFNNYYISVAFTLIMCYIIRVDATKGEKEMEKIIVGLVIVCLFSAILTRLFIMNKRPKDDSLNVDAFLELLEEKKRPLTAKEAREITIENQKDRALELEKEVRHSIAKSINTQASLGRGDTIQDLSFKYEEIPRKEKEQIKATLLEELKERGYTIKEEGEGYVRIYW